MGPTGSTGPIPQPPPVIPFCPTENAESFAACTDSILSSNECIQPSPFNEVAIVFDMGSEDSAAQVFTITGPTESDIRGAGRGHIERIGNDYHVQLRVQNKLLSSVSFFCDITLGGRLDPPASNNNMWDAASDVGEGNGFPAAPFLNFTDSSLEGMCSGPGGPADPRIWSFFKSGIQNTSVCFGIAGTPTEGAVIRVSPSEVRPDHVPQLGFGANNRNFANGLFMFFSWSVITDQIL